MCSILEQSSLILNKTKKYIETNIQPTCSSSIDTNIIYDQQHTIQYFELAVKSVYKLFAMHKQFHMSISLLYLLMHANFWNKPSLDPFK